MIEGQLHHRSCKQNVLYAADILVHILSAPAHIQLAYTYIYIYREREREIDIDIIISCAGLLHIAYHIA